MPSKTLQDGLNDYGIGAKIRALRLKKKIGHRAVAGAPARKKSRPTPKTMREAARRGD